MLNIQRALKKVSLEKIIDKYKLKVCYHPTDDRVILNYTIFSPKFSPIAKECRGLVLNKTTGKLIARSFPRFFNIGETKHGFKKFDWDNFVCQEKLDGSLILLYHWHDEWHVNTRGSFGDGKVNESEKTWRDLFDEAFYWRNFLELWSNEKFTYVFELTSPYNKVVRSYSSTNLTLLSVFDGEKELPLSDVDIVGDYYGRMPNHYYNLNNLDIIQEALIRLEDKDPTQEGFVIRDINNNRWKLKNKGYLNLHRMKGEGENRFHPKYLLPFILKQDSDELLTYFPEVETKYYEYYDKVWKSYGMLCFLWGKYKDLESQKEFALAIKNNPLSCVLFNCRNKNLELLESFKQSERSILRILLDENM